MVWGFAVSPPTVDGALVGGFGLAEQSLVSPRHLQIINEVLGGGRRTRVRRETLEVYVHDTKADYSKIHEATGRVPEISFEEGVQKVCEPYLE
ncbi:hypothetical protein C5B91_09075 [Haloferax sp. Atlit-10N]|nr:hypothetical protein C5B87_11895 [Haloferax sp. Atlit-16N]RDZ59360.1 hypothetical protein C5B91_09075 [Haloferax sp. Atlit-10N]